MSARELLCVCYSVLGGCYGFLAVARVMLCGCYSDLCGFKGVLLLQCSGWLLGDCYSVARVKQVVTRVLLFWWLVGLLLCVCYTVLGGCYSVLAVSREMDVICQTLGVAMWLLQFSRFLLMYCSTVTNVCYGVLVVSYWHK